MSFTGWQLGVNSKCKYQLYICAHTTQLKGLLWRSFTKYIRTCFRRSLYLPWKKRMNDRNGILFKLVRKCGLKSQVTLHYSSINEVNVHARHCTSFTYTIAQSGLRWWCKLELYKVNNYNPLLALFGICLLIISEWPPLSHRLLWFWWIESQVTGQLTGLMCQ